MENDNPVIEVDIPDDTNSVTDNLESIAITEALQTDNSPEEDTTVGRKRRRQDGSQLEMKRAAEEEYNRELVEQQYKRLMHLLNRSKFYASYIVEKINSNSEKQTSKTSKKGSKKADSVDENVPPPDKMKKKIHATDIRNYISKDVKQKINLEKDKLNLNETKFEANSINNSENGMENVDNNSLQISKYFNGNLRDYQKEGFQWLKVLYENGINGILADEMGLGKTVQVIALICHLIEKQQDGPYLIVVPLSTVPNWKIEFEKFSPKLPVIIFHGTTDERSVLQRKIKQKYKITETFKTQPIVVTTFEVPLHEKQFLRSQHWRYIIIDEGHRIKNYNCLLIKILKTCKSMNRLLLTGTPLQNNLAELWSLLNFLLPEIFDDLAVFESWFDAKEFQDDKGTQKFLQLEKEKHVLASLREILQPFMLRREKSDVCIEIPPKKELIVYAPLTKLQHDLYKAVLNRDIYNLCKSEESPVMYSEDGTRPKRRCVLKNIPNNVNQPLKKEASPSPYYESNESNDSNESNESTEVNGLGQLKPEKDLSIWKQFTNITERNQDFLLNLTYRNRLMMYKKIVNHPYLVYCPLKQNGSPKIDEELVRASGKLMILDKMLTRLKAGGHKVLLFSTMKTILDLIEDYISLRNYKFVRLDGSVSLEERAVNIQKFNTDPNVFLFLITTRAGGVGLNLIGADTVVIYDSDWNPQMDIQAMARCHRIGQTKPVVIYKLCTKKTLDEAIINRAEAKRFLEKMVISKQVGLNVNSKETLMQLQMLLESKETQVVESENEVFTEEELSKLLDRSDLYANQKES